MSEVITAKDYADSVDMPSVLRAAGYVSLERGDGMDTTFVRLDDAGHRVRGDKFTLTHDGKHCIDVSQQRVFDASAFITAHPQLFIDYRPGMSSERLVAAVCHRLSESVDVSDSQQRGEQNDISLNARNMGTKIDGIPTIQSPAKEYSYDGSLYETDLVEGCAGTPNEAFLRDFSSFAKSFYNDVGFISDNARVSDDLFTKDLRVAYGIYAERMWIEHSMPIDHKGDDVRLLVSYNNDGLNHQFTLRSVMAQVSDKDGRLLTPIIRQDETFDNVSFVTAVRDALITNPDILLYPRATAENVIPNTYHVLQESKKIQNNRLYNDSTYAKVLFNNTTDNYREQDLIYDLRGAGLRLAAAVGAEHLNATPPICSSEYVKDDQQRLSLRESFMLPLGEDAHLTVGIALKPIDNDLSRFSVSSVRGIIQHGDETLPISVAQGNGNNLRLFAQRAKEVINTWFPSLRAEMLSARSGYETAERSGMAVTMSESNSTSYRPSFHR